MTHSNVQYNQLHPWGRANILHVLSSLSAEGQNILIGQNTTANFRDAIPIKNKQNIPITIFNSHSDWLY